MREPLESYLRDEPLPEAGHLLLRGSPLTLDKFRADAARAARRFSYQGEPCPGLSTELARTGGEADQLMAGPRLTG